jgi:hypothetical protein
MAKDTMLNYDGLTATQRSQLTAASELYAKHLTELAKAARALGKETEATAYETEAQGVTADIVPKLQSEDGVKLRAHEVKIIERGLTFFLKNLRAAKGTMRGLGKFALAEKFGTRRSRRKRTWCPSSPSSNSSCDDARLLQVSMWVRDRL